MSTAEIKLDEPGRAPVPMRMRRTPALFSLLDKHPGAECGWECVMVDNVEIVGEDRRKGEGIGETHVLIAEKESLFCYNADASEDGLMLLQYEIDIDSIKVYWSSAQGRNILKINVGTREPSGKVKYGHRYLHFESTDRPENEPKNPMGLMKHLTQHMQRANRDYELGASDIDASELGAEYGPAPCLTVGFVRLEMPHSSERHYVCGGDDEGTACVGLPCCICPIVSWEVLSNYISCWYPMWGVADTLCSWTPCCPRTPAPRSNNCCPDDETFVFPACAVRSHHGCSVPQNTCPGNCSCVPGVGLVAGALFIVMAPPVAAGSLCCPKYCAVKVFENYHTGNVDRGAMSCEYWSCVYRDPYYNTSFQGLPRWVRELDTESQFRP